MSVANRCLSVRWLLLAILALGLIIMHHAPVGHTSSPEHGSMPVAVMAADPLPAVSVAPTPDGHGMGLMLHGCLAVLGQVLLGVLLMLLLVAGLVAWADRARLRVPRARARAPDRADNAGGRSLLASVCVLRL